MGKTYDRCPGKCERMITRAMGKVSLSVRLSEGYKKCRRCNKYLKAKNRTRCPCCNGPFSFRVQKRQYRVPAVTMASVYNRGKQE